jgi:hypothetical protein
MWSQNRQHRVALFLLVQGPSSIVASVTFFPTSLAVGSPLPLDQVLSLFVPVSSATVFHAGRSKAEGRGDMLVVPQSGTTRAYHVDARV